MVNIECNYTIKIKKILGKSYSCETKNNLDITSSELSVISSVNGTHEKGKTLNDVSTFGAKNKNILNFPKDLEKFFKKLERIRISDGRMKEICADDLMPFPLLKELSLKDNDIEVIEDGTFAYNPMLEYINFEDNKIVHFGENVFDHLSMKLMYLTGNICIDFSTSDSNDVPEVIRKIKVNCTNMEFLGLEQRLTKLEERWRFVKLKNFPDFIVDVDKLRTSFNSSNFKNLSSISDRIEDLHQRKSRSYWRQNDEIKQSRLIMSELKMSQQKINIMSEENSKLMLIIVGTSSFVQITILLIILIVICCKQWK